MMKEIKCSASAWIRLLRLRPHPEGGYYREAYRSPETISAGSLPGRYGSRRSFSTAIYFLLAAGQYSAFHRLKSDEIWHFYDGAPIDIFVISPGGKLARIRLGNNPAAGEEPQRIVRAGSWFAAAIAIQNGKSLPAMLRIPLQAGRIQNQKSYSLIGCTVAPGFDFADFEVGRREELCAKFPRHARLIANFTRG